MCSDCPAAAWLRSGSWRERELNAEATRFSGSSSAGVDGKGRIVLPADFRRVLEAKSCSYFYATPDLQHPEFLECFGPEHARIIEMQLDEFDPYDEDGRVLRELLIGRMKQLPFDSDGRFVLPAAFRERTGIDKDAFFIGLGATFHIRNKAAGEARSKELEERGSVAARRMMSPGRLRRQAT